MLKRTGSDKIFLGLDGGNHVGFAVWDKQGKQFLNLSTVDFWEAIKLIDYWENWCQMNAKTLVSVVEDVSANKPVFKLAGVYLHTPGAHSQKLSAAGKVAEGVGRVKQTSDLLIKYCEKKCSQVIKLKPGGRSMTKMKADAFKKITGYSKRTSEHARDAAMLVYGY